MFLSVSALSAMMWYMDDLVIYITHCCNSTFFGKKVVAKHQFLCHRLYRKWNVLQIGVAVAGGLGLQQAEPGGVWSISSDNCRYQWEVKNEW